MGLVFWWSPWTLAEVLAALLLMQQPADVARENKRTWSTYTPATHVRSSDAVLGSWLSLEGLLLADAVVWEMNPLTEDLTFSLYT